MAPTDEIQDNPPPYAVAIDAHRQQDDHHLAPQEKSQTGSSAAQHDLRDPKDSRTHTSAPSPLHRRKSALRGLVFLVIGGMLLYSQIWSFSEESAYSDEDVKFHSWSASLSWKGKGHHHHDHHHHHHHYTPHSSWWPTSASKGRPPCTHRARLQRAVKAMLESIYLSATHIGPIAESIMESEANATVVPDVSKFLEAQFLTIPDPKSAREALKSYTSKLHVAGTKADYESALKIQAEWADLLGAPKVEDPTTLLFESGSAESIHYLTGDWRASGSTPRVWTDTYYVWLNYHRNSSLSLAKPNGETTFTANLKEDVVDEDPTSSIGNSPFHGYSKPGNATGPIVYAGMCTIDDFAALKKKGVKVEGAITLCRYGGPFRGLKVRASADAGAVATLIYSDPLEDGNVTEANGAKVYPDGPARHPLSVQRGSVQGLSFYPGDPGTPGEPSYKNATRLDPDDADSLPKIPSLPISFSNAKPLLEALVGHGVNTRKLEKKGAKWVGKVPGVEEYWSGPSDLIASLENDMTPIEPRPIWNTYAYIPGLLSDEVVITAVHRDAWTFGGADPSSGTAAMHEVVAGLGHLRKNFHWRPLRSILIASWDAEEYGLVGSTEFGEDYAKWLKDHAVAYFNTDVAAAGSSLKIASSPSLSQLYREVAQQIENPESREGLKLNITTTTPLGSGSDYSVFLQHLGIPSSDIGYAYSAQNGDAVYHYHSNYDSFYFMDNFGDPDFKRITTIAKLLGMVTVRMSQSLFLQLDVKEYVDVVGGYINTVQKKFEKARKDGKIGKGRSASHGKWQGCHHALFDRLRKSHARLQEAAESLQREKARIEEDIQKLPGGLEAAAVATDASTLPHDSLPGLLGRVAKVNNALRVFEQVFISKDGLKDRPWYKSLLVGPGRWRGYGATALPGLTEAITLDRDWDEVIREVKRLEHSMETARDVLRRGSSKRFR